MIRLGRVSMKTRGPVILGYFEDLIICVPGARYRECGTAR